MARLERETAMVNQDFKALEESYGDDVLNSSSRRATSPSWSATPKSSGT